jgi:3-hydroxyacyl-CoA dehydrogenase
MRLLDMAGLDIYQSVASFLNAQLCNRDDVSPMVSQATEQGRLGMKSGAGLFEYSADDLASLPRERAARLVAVRRALEAGGPMARAMGPNVMPRLGGIPLEVRDLENAVTTRLVGISTDTLSPELFRIPASFREESPF